MNTNKKVIQLGLVLFLLNMAIFFLLFFLFSTQGSISEANYFHYSVIICCFILPVIYAGVGFYSSYSSAKIEPLHFGLIWKLTFMPMFIGGLLSLISIFVFFNTTGSWAEDSLQRGWYEFKLSNLDPELMDEKESELAMSMDKMTDLTINIFRLRMFFLSFTLILFYNFFISTIFAVFLKNRRV